MKVLLPKLQQMGNSFQMEVIFIDMRWGIPDENTFDHLTWIACQQEIHRCSEESMGLYFLSLQSQKYGYHPIPKYLPSEAVKDLIGTFSIEDRKVFDSWYEFDANQLPAGRYCLRPLNSDNLSIFWKTIQPRLLSLLEGVEFESKLLVGRSVTEYEFRYAVNLARKQEEVNKLSRLAWFSRNMSGITRDDPNYSMFSDTLDASDGKAQKLQRLVELMNNVFDEIPDENRCVVQSDLSFRDYNLMNKNWEKYFERFKTRMERIFTHSIASRARQMDSWKENSQGMGLPGIEMNEILHHYELANRKCSSFYGREGLLNEAQKMVDSQSSHVTGIRLGIVGNSGCGKTAFMSKLASLFYERDPASNKPVLIRFGGTSPSSTRLLTLIVSLCHQIHYFQGLPFNHKNILSKLYDPESNTLTDLQKNQSFESLVNYYLTLCNSYPHYLFLDSLDQIVDETEHRSRATFLNCLAQNKSSTIILSTLPARYGKISLEVTLKQLNVLCFTIPDSTKQASNIMRILLQAESRSLTPQQWGIVEQALAADSRILYLRLAISIVRKWTSFQPLDSCVLLPTVSNIVNQIFDSLEHAYGRVFTRAAVAYITLGGGITDSQLLELLTMDGEVMTVISQYNKAEKFPLHMWLRLKSEMSDFLVERENNGLQWYHRQIWETLETRISPDERKKCTLLLEEHQSSLILEVDETNCRAAIYQNNELHYFSSSIYDLGISLPGDAASFVTVETSFLSLMGTAQSLELNFYLEEIFARQFIAILDQIEKKFGRRNFKVFVLFPGNFNLVQRTAVLDAIKAAGLECDRAELAITMASVVEHFSGLPTDERAQAYFQLTDTALECSVIASDESIYEVLDCSFDETVSSRKITLFLFHKLVQSIQKDFHVHLQDNKEAVIRLFLACEKAKTTLFDNAKLEMTSIDLPSLWKKGVDFSQIIRPSDFVEYFQGIRPQVEGLVSRCIQALKSSHCKHLSLRYVFIGTLLTNHPAFEKIFHEICVKLNQSTERFTVKREDYSSNMLLRGGYIRSEWSLSKGSNSQIRLRQYQGELSNWLIIQLVPRNIGIAFDNFPEKKKKEQDELFSSFVPSISDAPIANDESTVVSFYGGDCLVVPASKTHRISIHHENQTSFHLRFFEGNGGNGNVKKNTANNCLCVKQMKVSQIQAMPVGQVSLTVSIYTDNLLKPVRIDIEEDKTRRLISSIFLDRSKKWNLEADVLRNLKLHLNESHSSRWLMPRKKE